MFQKYNSLLPTHICVVTITNELNYEKILSFKNKPPKLITNNLSNNTEQKPKLAQCGTKHTQIKTFIVPYSPSLSNKYKNSLTQFI